METPDLVPFYLEAGTKDELVALMIRNNLSNQKFYKYFDIQKDGKRWVAWYYERFEVVRRKK